MGGAVYGRRRPILALAWTGSTGRANGDGSGEDSTDIGAVRGRKVARAEGPVDVVGRAPDRPSERENGFRVEVREGGAASAVAGRLAARLAESVDFACSRDMRGGKGDISWRSSERRRVDDLTC